MTSLYQWVKYLHILSAFFFLLAHGVSMFVALQLKRETKPERMQALLDLSTYSVPLTFQSLLVLLLTGVAAGFMGRWWGSGWMWLSLLLLIGLTVWMVVMAPRGYQTLRRLLGMPHRTGKEIFPAGKQSPWAEIEAQVAATRPREMLWIGLGGFSLILWLMVFKPF
ncbi:MAG: DUF2269 family protein [Anaerolineales bacterium]|nr:DUF2269 family protein [Anaerolineales bacterium]